MKGHHITIVDDDEAVRHSLQALLEAAGLAVDVFPSGEDFLAAAPTTTCVILDLHLPGLDGIETMRRLHRGGAATPVILISARLDPGARTRATLAGAAAVVEKPLHERRLLDCINRALEPGPGRIGATA
jgi:FixJ family two-component response regulator